MSENDEGTILILNKSTYTCNKGKFAVKFKANSEGILGFIFRYDDDGDFYIFEIAVKKQTFVRFRKKVAGIYKIIAIAPFLEFNIEQWYSAIIQMNDNKFNIYITKKNINDKHRKIFDSDIIDHDLKIGLVGLSTFKITAYFSDISLNPIDNFEDNNQLLYVDEESLERNLKFIKKYLLKKLVQL